MLEASCCKHFATTSRPQTANFAVARAISEEAPVARSLQTDANNEVIMSGDDSTEMLVRDLMTADVFTVDRNEALLTAERVMTLGRIRHVIVIDDEGGLAGVVSQRDLFHSGLVKALGFGTHAVTKTLDTLLVKEVMSTNVATTRPDAPLRDAAALMYTRKIGCLPVLDGAKLVGILTEADFVKLHTQ